MRLLDGASAVLGTRWLLRPRPPLGGGIARFGVERTLCANTFRKFFVVVFSDAESSFKGIQTPAYPRPYTVPQTSDPACRDPGYCYNTKP